MVSLLPSQAYCPHDSGSHTTLHNIWSSIALITCYCQSVAISVIVLLLPSVWVWLSYHNVSCSNSEISVVLPGPASMNPPDIHVIL